MDEEKQEQELENIDTITVNIALVNGTKVEYAIPYNASVAFLVNKIKEDPTINKPEDRILTLIYHGRILSPTTLFKDLENLRIFTVHLFFRLAPLTNDTPQAIERRGFDRLAVMGYSPQQISQIRSSFHQTHGSADQSHEEQLDVEEEWFPVIFNQDRPLEVLQLPRPENPPENNTATDTERDDDGDPFLEEPASWIQFTLGLIFGLVFGLGSVLLLMVAFTQIWFATGVLAGIGLHYCASYFYE